jgi:hypothetical protein
MKRWQAVPVGVSALCLGLVAGASAQQPAPEERVAVLKKSLQENQARLRQYEWVETTVVSLKGEEKSRTQKRCYYGADGKVQKTAIAEPAQEASEGRRGGRRQKRLKQRVVEKKKGELTDYMKRAVDLVQLYVPPDPGLIQRSKDGGKASISPLGGQGQVKLEFHDYLEAGDSLSIDLDATTNAILGVKVGTYIATPDDPVSLDVRFARLPDGTSYPAASVLGAPAKSVQVSIENTGHRKAVP